MTLERMSDQKTQKCINYSYLSAGTRAHIILKHHTVQLFRCHGIAETCQQVTRVGVIDQHRYRADHYGKVDKILSTETTSNLILVARAAEHHRDIDGRVQEERPSLQRKRGGDKEEKEEEKEEERGPGGRRRMSPGKGHAGRLLPGKEGGRRREKEREESSSQIYKLLYFCDAFDIMPHDPSVHIHPLLPSPGLSPSLTPLYDSISPAFRLVSSGKLCLCVSECACM